MAERGQDEHCSYSQAFLPKPLSHSWQWPGTLLPLVLEVQKRTSSHGMVCKGCSLFLCHNGTEQEYFFLFHTQHGPICEEWSYVQYGKTKAFSLHLYRDIFYTFYSGLLSITALLTYANNECPYTVWYLDTLHASIHRQWLTVSVACETHHVSLSFLQSRLWRLQVGTKWRSTSLYGDVFVDSTVQRSCS